MKEFMDKIGFWGQLGVAAGAAVLAAVLLAWFAYPPYPKTKAEIIKLEKQRNDLRSQISQAKSVKEKLTEFKEEIKRLEERLKTFLDILPSEKDTDSLLRKIHNLAEESNVTVSKWDKAKLTKKDMFSEYSIKVTFEGNYHNIATLFDKLRNIERILYVSDLNMKAQKKGDDPNLTIKGDAVLTTFIMKSQETTETQGAEK